MPYPQKPRWAARTTLILRTFFYTLTFIAGIGAIFLTPTTIANQLSVILTVVWGWLLMLGSVTAIYGVVRKLFRFEFIALPFIITGMSIYGVTILSLLVETPSRLAQASAVTALLVITIIRYVELWVVTLKLSRLHDKRLQAVQEDKEDEDVSK